MANWIPTQQKTYEGILAEQAKTYSISNKPSIGQNTQGALMPPVAPTPWLRTAAEKVAEPFQWIREHLEKPWAEAITAPFRPTSVTYEEWQEPVIRMPWGAEFRPVKGLAEFSMPLWWLPYFGWAAKGAGMIPRIGGTLAKGVLSAERALAYPIVKPLELMGKGVIKIAKIPAFQKMKADVFKADVFRALGDKLSKLPAFRTAAGIVNPSAIAHTEAEMGRVVHGGLREIAENSANMTLAQMERHGTSPQIKKLFDLDDMMRSTTIQPKLKDAPTNWWDIASNPKAYKLSEAQSGYIKDYHATIDAMITHAEEMGVKIPKLDILEGMHYVPRAWQGRLGILDTRTGIWRAVGTRYQPEAWEKIMEVPLRTRIPGARIGVRTSFELPRYYELAEEALTKGLLPKAWGPAEILDIYVRGMYRRITDQVTADALKPLGKTIKEFIPQGIKERSAEAALQYRALRTLSEIIPRAKRGEVIPTQTLRSIRERLPEYTDRLESILKPAKLKAPVTPEVTKLTDDIWNRMTPVERDRLMVKAKIEKLEGQRWIELWPEEKRALIREFKKEQLAIPKAEVGKVTKQGALTQLNKEVIGLRKGAYADYMAARSIRTRELAAIRGGVPGWRPVGQPFAAGRLFPEEVAKDLNKMLQDRSMPIFTNLSNVNALSRFMVTGFDFGAGLIQGVPLLMTNPIKWGKAMGLSIGAFFDPVIRARYLSRPENIAVLERLIPEGLLIGNSEFMQAVGGGLMRPIQAIDKLQVMQRFATSFNTFGDMARIEWAKGLLPLVQKEGRSLRELSSFVNEATGVMSSRALGVGATQREVESAIFLFAPRYFRANFSLWADMARGGLRGQLARDTLASMIMGGFFWYYGVCKALGQEPNLSPTSGKFMTVEIGNQHIGLGSMQVAMLRLLGNIYQTATEDPQGFIKLDSRDNPLVRFFRSRVAPVTATLWDITTGRTFIGEPLDTIPDFSKNILADRLLPFWAASYISDDPKPEWFAGLGEVAGMRTWPLQLWERRDELRERLALADYGKPWYPTKTEKGINELQKEQLEKKYGELERATEATRLQRLERGGVKEQMWHAYQEDRKRVRAEYDSKLWAAEDLVNRGQITGYDFRELVKNAGARLRGGYRSIETNPVYKEVMEFFAQPMTEDQIKDTPLEDIASDIYMALMYSGDLEDAAGQYNFEEAERREQIFVAQFGEEMLKYIKELQMTRRDIPPLMQEYYKAQEIMRPYWKVRDTVEKLFGKIYAESSRGQRLITKERQRLRAYNPEVEKYYTLFYART